jgi:hypothetical protein
MGINIMALKLKEQEEVETWGGGTYTHWKTESIDSFDSYRRSGDREFIFDSNIEWKYQSDGPDDDMWAYSYMKPEHPNKAREWVKANVYKANQERLLNIIDLMEKEKDIYLHYSI